MPDNKSRLLAGPPPGELHPYDLGPDLVQRYLKLTMNVRSLQKKNCKARKVPEAAQRQRSGSSGLKKTAEN